VLQTLNFVRGPLHLAHPGGRYNEGPESRSDVFRPALGRCPCALFALVSRAKETKRALNNIAVARYGGFRAKGSGSGKGGPLVFSSFSSSVVAEKIGLVSSEELRSWSTGRLQKTLDVLEKERREIEEHIRFGSSD